MDERGYNPLMKLPPLSHIAGILAGVAVIAGLAFSVSFFLPCSPAPETESEESSHGFRILSTPVFKSFEHNGKKICVPDGWEALGAKSTGDGWVRYDGNGTGVLIRSDAFLSETLGFEWSSYTVRMFYPISTKAKDHELYTAIVKNSFERVGRVFNDTKANKKRPHDVLISPGIEGTPVGAEGYAYPDPHRGLSVLVRPPQHPRSEELFIHATMHLYNRQEGKPAYLKRQLPIPPSDFEELEAAWAETPFRTSESGRTSRLLYLYNVHTAVQTKNFSLISAPPFNDREAFIAINPSVAPARGASYLDYQYGHYVLAPLSMVAVEGLLRETGADVTLEEILKRVHAGNAESLFAELEAHLGKVNIEKIKSWMFGGTTVPWELVERGADSYIRHVSL